MMDTFKISTGKVDIEPGTWLTPLIFWEGAASTRNKITTGCMNLARGRAKSDLKRNQFSCRVVPQWKALPNIVKNQDSLNKFKNVYNNNLEKKNYPVLNCSLFGSEVVSFC